MASLTSTRGAGLKTPAAPSCLPRLARPSRRMQRVSCSAQKAPSVESLGQKMAAASAAAVLSMSALSGAPALAGEFDLLGAPAPTTAYVVDDANVLSKATRGELNSKLKNLEITTGYRLNVLTVRKLEFETDPFAFADKVDEQWYPEAASLDKKGALLIVTTAKSGAVTGGPSFNKAVGDDLVDSIITDNIPIYSEAEAYNQAVLSSVARLEAKLQGNEVPAAPVRNEQVRKRNYKTKEETEKSKTVTATIVAVLLLIAFVVPMLQYYGYTARD